MREHNKKGKIRDKLVITIFIIFLLSSKNTYSYDIRGKVYQSQGVPSPNTLVWLVHSIKGPMKIQTEAEGKFAFTELPMGEVSLIAKDKNKKLGGISFLLMKNEEEVNINLFEGNSYKLKIYNPNLIPISGAYIRRMWIGDLFCIPAEEIAELDFGWLRSDDNGEIFLENIPPHGFLRILVSHIDYADTYLPFVPLNNKGMDIILKKGMIVRGRVTKDGKGINNAFIIYLPKGVGNTPFILPTKTDKEGLFRCRLEKGEYRIFASYKDFPNTVPKEISITGNEEEEISLDFEFQNPLYIEGKVCLNDGTPCKLAKVVIYEESGAEDFVFTDETGKYLLKSGSQKVKVKIIPPPGFITENLPEIPVDFQNEKKIHIPDVHVKQLPIIKGKITLPDGSSGDRVFIQSKNLDFPVFEITRDEGNFEILFPSVPEVNAVDFTAEHALRFLRSDFSFNLYGENNPINITLHPFEPKQEKYTNKSIQQNKLEHLIDKPAPEIKCRSWFNFTGDGNPLLQLQGKVVLILFWGGFDKTPFEMRHIEEARALFDLYKGISDVAILSIHDGLSEEEEVDSYVKDFNIKFPVGIDTEDTQTFTSYSIQFIPQFMLIDKKGIIRYTDIVGRSVELIKILRRTAGN